MEEKIINEAALDYGDQVRKMDAWHNGTRGANVKSMSFDKLNTNAQICKQKGYITELNQLETEARSRGLHLATMGPIQPQQSSQQAASQQANTQQSSSLITFDVSDLDRYTAKIVKQYESDPDAIIKVEMAKTGTIKHLILDLVYAIVLGLDKNLKDRLKEFLTINCGLSIDELKAHLRGILNNQEMCDELNSIKKHIDESLNEDIEKHDELNPKLWENNKLKPEVKEKIELIVNEFLDNLKEDEISIDVSDIILIGSNCSYNYTKDSDLDIHIIAKHIDAPENLYDKIYSAYRSIFNKKLDIEFYGIPVEIFVEIDGVPHVSNGCYSVMNDEWIKEPVKEDIPEIDKEAFDKEFKVWEDGYNKIVDNSEEKLDESLHEDVNTAKSIIADQIRGEWEAISNYDKAVSELENLDGDFKNAIDILNDIADEEEVHVGEEQKVLSELDNNVLNNIKEGEEEAEEKISEPAKDLNFDESLNEEIRTKQLDEIESFISDIYALRQKGLQESGEYGIENLVFKEIRNKGYLDNLKDLKNQLVSKELSLESLEEDTVKNSKGKWVNKGEDGTHGEFKTKKAADAQRKAMFANGYHEELEERLDDKQRYNYRNELSRIAFAQPIIQDNGLFNIYNIKEDDIDRVTRRIRDLDYIEWVQKNESGKYDFSKVAMFGQPQSKYYNITGKIKEEI